MNKIKEDCIDILVDYILTKSESLNSDDWAICEVDDAKNKIVEVANATDEKELGRLYREIKKDFS